MSHIYYFNPGHENAILNRLPSYTAPSSITTMMRELASLPAWYADVDDVVLVEDEYLLEYHEKLINSGIHLPNLIYNKELLKFYKQEVCMWGITPQGIRLFNGFNNNYCLNMLIPSWNEKYIYLNSRMIARDILIELKESLALFSPIEVPIFCNDLEAIDNIVNTRKEKLLAKSPYSSSGRGLLWLPSTGLTRAENQILQGMLNKQGGVSIEPVYNKVLDFAMEFMSDGDGGISFVGYSLFTTNSKGAYEGNILDKQETIVSAIVSLINIDVLTNTKLKLLEILSKYYGSDYKGCVGVDMMIVEIENTSVLHPCVEINMRYNMGYLSIKLFDNHISSNSKGCYFLDFNAKGEMYSEHLRMEHEFPLILEDRRVKSGYLSLCPVQQNTKYRAYILVEDL